MSHTNEPWKTVSRGDEYADDIDAFKGEGWNADVTIAMNIGKDNARRIVACVNWCKGNSTEGMERAVEIGRPYAVERDDAYGRELEITKQRDELMAELNGIKQNIAFAATCNLVARMEQAEKQRDELFAKLYKMEGRSNLAEANRDELLAAMERYLPFIPTSTAKEGGATRHSENVCAADQFRDAIASVKGS